MCDSALFSTCVIISKVSLNLWAWFGCRRKHLVLFVKEARETRSFQRSGSAFQAVNEETLPHNW